MVTKVIPANPGKIILINPTKYLGNLLLAGGLMQAFEAHCQLQGIAFKIVIDESFRGLCEHSFAPDTLEYFPRRSINKASLVGKLVLYWRTLKNIRAFQADLAFNIEEDAATSHLTRLSGARFKLGCSAARHSSGYDHVLPVQFENRPPGVEHRWYSFYDIFAVLGLSQPPRTYLALQLDPLPDTLKQKLQQCGWQADTPTIALHAGATKNYKKWPLGHMASLAARIQAAGMQAVLIGAGDSDMSANDTIRQILADKNSPAPIDLCNRLSLVELAQFLGHCQAMVGNDSGPFHLGSAMGIKGIVLWGPTNRAIWGPLGENSEVMTGSFACDPACNKGHCLHDHRCLREISPDQVFAQLRPE